ncbi:hypothetical protein IPL85_05455 [Candidatus Saccharibacteria bacterium]|nr:MAG: hypothetical protein IPL85_05455 [Candidatus Saccharibacteria bacterium]
MSRVLAQLLGANQVPFRQQVQQLERAAGMPSADIRLAAHIMQGTREKIRQLGLDPLDTTGPELYTALQTRLKQDEARVRAALNVRADNDPVDVLQNVARQLNNLDHHSDMFVVKPAAMKQLLKKLKPKATMKRLGYRSMDSMLKHESPAQLLAAARATESAEWHEARLAAYKKLQVSDFEARRPQFIVPVAKQWPKLAANYAQVHKNHLIAVPEMGAVIILPVEDDLPGMAITSLVLSLHLLNDMRALSAYNKLLQVQPNFGELVQKALAEEPLTDVVLGGSRLSWQAVHWFYGHGHASYHPEVFEPHVQPEDLAWHSVGAALASLQSVLGFWEETDMLGLLDSTGEATSLNVLDVALGVCNGFGYGERVLKNMRETLGRELFARYLRQDNLQDMLAASLGKQLAPSVEFE